MKSTINATVLLAHVEHDSNSHFVFCPALKLFGTGNTREGALKTFEEAFSFFLEFHTRNKTLEKALVSMGWEISGSEVLKEPDFKLPAELLHRNANIVSQQRELAFA